VGSVTENFGNANFQSESPLHASAQEFLLDAFLQGWANPSKGSFASKKAAIMLDQAKEQIASHLGVRVEQIHPVSNIQSGYALGVQGLMGLDSTLFYSAVDRSEIYALAKENRSERIPVSLAGLADYPQGEPNDVLSWQWVNGETGVLAGNPGNFQGKTFVDATAVSTLRQLPENWSTALWDSITWQGPASLAIFALKDSSIWSNPFPHTSPGLEELSFSVPLTVASAIALEAHQSDYTAAENLMRSKNEGIRKFLATEIGDVDIAGNLDSTLPHLLSFSILYADAKIVQDELEAAGFAVDSGSACSSANLEPSHVLAAMGLLTHGNVRMTIRLEHTDQIIDSFLSHLKRIVDVLRR
jgi:cysteine desulfurase